MSTNTNTDTTISPIAFQFPIFQKCEQNVKMTWTKTGTNDVFRDQNFQFHQNIGKISTNTNTDKTMLGASCQFQIVQKRE